MLELKQYSNNSFLLKELKGKISFLQNSHSQKELVSQKYLKSAIERPLHFRCIQCKQISHSIVFEFLRISLLQLGQLILISRLQFTREYTSSHVKTTYQGHPVI